MSRINLLPQEVKERQRVRRQTAAVTVVGVLVLVALGAFFFLQQVRLSSAEDDLREQQAVNTALQQDIAELQQFDELATEVELSRTLVGQLLQNQVLWSGVLRDISLVIPGQVWLDSLTGTITAEAPGVTATTTGDGLGLVGNIAFTGKALGDHRNTALWLARLEDVAGFINPWLASSTKSEIGSTEVVEFNSSVDLTQDAVTPPQGTGGGRP